MTRVAVALALPFAMCFRLPVFADEDDDGAGDRLGREIAERFVADFFGEHSAEHDLFVSTAKKDRTFHFPADGQVVTFYDGEKTVKVSTALGRVMSLDLGWLDRTGSCTPDDERALAPDPDHYLADVQKFLDATAPEVDLATLTPEPHESLCKGGRRVSSHTWRELPDDAGVYYGSTRVEVKFDLFTKEILGFTVQTMTWDDAINVDAQGCRNILANLHGDRPGIKITHLTLIRVFPLEGPAYPAWVATFESDPANDSGFILGSRAFSVNVHAQTGEIIEDLKEYKAQRSDPD